MNNVRREHIRRIVSQLEELRDNIGDLKYEEEEYLENMPDNLQTKHSVILRAQSKSWTNQ